MGSGRGNFVRTAFILKKHKSFLEFRGYDNRYLRTLNKRIFYKLPFFLYLKCIKLKYCVFKNKKN